jgi:hypothetical protein
MRQRRAVVSIVLVAFLASGCGVTIRDNFRKSALVAGNVALDIDKGEMALYTSGVIGLEKHKKAGPAIVVMLQSVQVYERAARMWPETGVMPSNLPQAMADAVQAIMAVKYILAETPGAEKLLANLDHLKDYVTGGAK